MLMVMAIVTAAGAAAVLTPPNLLRRFRQLNQADEALIRRPRRRWRRNRQHDLDLPSLVRELAVLLDAGVTADHAWRAAVDAHLDNHGPWHDWATQIVAQSARQSIANALMTQPLPTRRDVDDLDHHTARAICVAWATTTELGAPLGPVLRQLAEFTDQDRDLNQTRQVALTGPTTSARVLLALPIVGTGLAQLAGFDVAKVLVTTPIGRASALVGLAFSVVGIVWVNRMLARHRRPVRHPS